MLNSRWFWVLLIILFVAWLIYTRKSGTQQTNSYRSPPAAYGLMTQAATSLRPNSQPAKINSSLQLLASQMRNSSHNLRSSMIFPFSDNHGQADRFSSSSENSPTASNIPRQTQLFANLDTPGVGINSTFSCPPQLPFAQSYTLRDKDFPSRFISQVYQNACYNDPPGTKNAHNDLLYGANQNIDPWGTAATLTAFIPLNVPEGCRNSHNTLSVTLHFNANNIQVKPLYTSINNQDFITGYVESNIQNIDCTKICNSLINQACASNLDYCNESISASYLVRGSYQLRKIPETFCSCQISSSGYKFTQAIDIESMANYNNPLSNVTCSNYPPL